ncbi:MAG: hypothetical protein ACKOBW_17875 [Planctomycetota bacterium]
MQAQIIFGIGLMVLAGGMLIKGRGRLMSADHPDLSDIDRRYERKRQFLGRVMVFLIGVIGLAMVSGAMIQNPRRILFFWSGVLSLVLALFVIALLDVLNTNQQLRRIRRQQQAAQQRWQQEMTAELQQRRAALDPQTKNR